MYHNGPHNPAPRPDAVLVPVMTQATNSSFLHNKTRFSLKVTTFHSKYHPLISKLFFSAAGLCNLLDFNVGEDGEKTERVVSLTEFWEIPKKQQREARDLVSTGKTQNHKE